MMAAIDGGPHGRKGWTCREDGGGEQMQKWVTSRVVMGGGIEAEVGLAPLSKNPLHKLFHSYSVSDSRVKG